MPGPVNRCLNCLAPLSTMPLPISPAVLAQFQVVHAMPIVLEIGHLFKQRFPHDVRLARGQRLERLGHL